MKNKFFQKITVLVSIVLVLSALFVFGTKAQAVHPYKDFKPFKFSFITDANLSLNWKNDYILYNLSQIILQDAINSANKIKDNDFIVFGGDTISNEDGKYSELQTFLDLTETINSPYYLIFGDKEANTKEDCTKNDITSEFKRKIFTEENKTYWKSEPVENVVLIGLDSSQTGKTEGYIDKEQLCWLENTLNDNKDKFTVILLHHLPKPLSEDLKTPDFKNFSITNDEEFTGLIAKYPQVKLIVNGNRYVNSVRKINNTLFVSVPSIAVYPNYFDEIEVSADKVNIVHKKISYKQIIKLAKNNLEKSELAKQYNAKKPKEIIKLNEGDEFSNIGSYRF
ncbi:MAG: metallophosphoesterase [bacterium]